MKVKCCLNTTSTYPMQNLKGIFKARCKICNIFTLDCFDCIFHFFDVISICSNLQIMHKMWLGILCRWLNDFMRVIEKSFVPFYLWNKGQPIVFYPKKQSNWQNHYRWVYQEWHTRLLWPIQMIDPTLSQKHPIESSVYVHVKFQS